MEACYGDPWLNPGLGLAKNSFCAIDVRSSSRDLAGVAGGAAVS